MQAGSDDRIRVAELMAALSLATDLGLGQPLEHELGVCLAALEIADRLGCSPEERSDVYYVALVAHVGCTGAAPFFASWMGGDDIAFQRGAQQLGAVSETTEDVQYWAGAPRCGRRRTCSATRWRRRWSTQRD